ncbi:glycoside hydrolase family 43 protein [Sutcliffiella rhizosphaerae]|uniref:Glycoside hydrolase n=1 Tax=Sutcliffiella rhizosphaerae TaxID=2880967 RepID=A0ABM8YMC4_9BACI|nr:glycoside hydrolase family 43 protein [Sutcliffiella rhizosphaerae]CAG9621101.1 hypothetical protein BACCIP111883_01873 [Sutcliffiella rhizosphaerae]
MTYQNPVISIKGLDHGDPAVLRYNGKYYLYHTGPREIRVYVSADLIYWEAAGIALHASDDPNHWAQIDLWAPEIIHENGTFYMYVTGAVKNEAGFGNDEIRRIGVAKSNNPTGPFTLAKEPLTDEWSIDAHPFKDDDGSYYLFYNVRNSFTRGPNDVIGTGNVVDKMTDLENLSGNPTMVVAPEHLWEGNKEHSFFWNEGPFVLKKDGIYYQMYSAGFFGDDTYGVYYATSTTPMGKNAMEDKSWKKWNGGQPILKTNDACHGPGHHVVVKGPNGVDDYIVYHGYEPDENIGERRVRVGRFKWEDAHIWLEPPVKEALPLPNPPSMDGRLIKETTELNVKLAKETFPAFHFETNICFTDTDLGELPFLSYEVTEQEKVVWFFDQQKQVISAELNGKRKMDDFAYTLPRNYDLSAYHFINVRKEETRIHFYLDHVLVMDVPVPFKETGTMRFINNGESQYYQQQGTILTRL